MEGQMTKVINCLYVCIDPTVISTGPIYPRTVQIGLGKFVNYMPLVAINGGPLCVCKLTK